MDKKTKFRRWLEIVFIYVGVPFSYYLDLIPVDKFIFLSIIFLIYLYIILKDRTLKRNQFRLNASKAWRVIFFRTTIIISFLLSYVWITFPEQFFKLPSQAPRMWVLLMVLYPLWSVIPQEFVFRVYFYHRFSGLIRNRNLFVLINALLFSFSHIIFRNYIALLFTFIASIMFSLTYLRYRSFSIVALEHSLYGNLIFTIGPGEFFYTP